MNRGREKYLYVIDLPPPLCCEFITSGNFLTLRPPLYIFSLASLFSASLHLQSTLSLQVMIELAKGELDDLSPDKPIQEHQEACGRTIPSTYCKEPCSTRDSQVELGF
jgi:hypothetical protein